VAIGNGVYGLGQNIPWQNSIVVEEYRNRMEQ
jgi:hypothetical protein